MYQTCAKLLSVIHQMCYNVPSPAFEALNRIIVYPPSGTVTVSFKTALDNFRLICPIASKTLTNSTDVDVFSCKLNMTV